MKDSAMEDAIRRLTETLRELMEALYGLSSEPGLPELPKIEDYLPENVRKRQILAISSHMKRHRKLAAEDIWEILRLRDEEGWSWRRIAEKFGVSVRAVRKQYRKHVEVVGRKRPPP